MRLFRFSPLSVVVFALAVSGNLAPSLFAQSSDKPKDSGSYGPVVTIVSPEYSDVLKDETPIVIAIAPRRYPAQSVELLVDGKAVSGVLQVQTKFKWDTKLFIDGPHSLGVRVTDTQGFIGQAETTVYINNNKKVDDSAPILRWLGVMSGEKLSGVAKIRLQAGDNFGVKYVFLNLNTAISPDVKPPLASWMTNRPPYEFTLDTTRFDDGLYVLDAYAWDDMENERNAPRLTVGFFNNGLKPPVVPAVPPAADPQGEPRKGADEGAGNDPILPPAIISKGALIPRMAQTPPQETITSNINSWVNTAPSSQNAAPREKLPNITTRSSAIISHPRIPATGLPAKFPSPDLNSPTAPIPAGNSIPNPAPTRKTNPKFVATPPTDIAPRIAASSSIEHPMSPAISRIEGAMLMPQTQTSSRFARVTPPGRQARAASPGASEMTAGLDPGATIAGQTIVEGQARIAPPSSASNAARNTAKPEVHWTTPADFGRSQTGKTNPVKSGTEQTAPAPRANPRFSAGIETPSAPSGFDSTSTTKFNTKPAISPEADLNTQRAPADARMARTTIALLPDLARPNAPNTISRSTVGALLTTIDETQHTRLVFAAPFAPARFTSTPEMPTLPLLAFSPDVNTATASPALRKAAIVVAPSLDAPIVHIARQDDTLAAIAARFKLPVSAVAVANNLEQNARIKKGAKVLLPQALLVSYQGQAVTGDVAPFLIGSTSVAPFRFLFEKQGGKMNWDAANQRITAQNADYAISLEIGSDKALVNEKEVLMDMAAFLLSGRTMVPVRFFEKALKAKVEWEPSTGRIFVATTR